MRRLSFSLSNCSMIRLQPAGWLINSDEIQEPVFLIKFPGNLWVESRCSVPVAVKGNLLSLATEP